LDGKNPTGWTFTESPPEDETNRKFSTTIAAADVAGAALVVPETGGKLAKQVVRARFLGSANEGDAGEQPFRPQLAALVASRENPWFAANAANRLGQVIGRLIGRSTASAPIICQRRTSCSFFWPDWPIQLPANRIRVITRNYQRTSALPRPDDHERHSRMAVKPMRPGVSTRYRSSYPPVQSRRRLQPLASRKHSANPRTNSRHRHAAGRHGGQRVNTGLPQFLKLLNGDVLHRESPDRPAKGGPEPAEAMVIYLAVLTRPTAEGALDARLSPGKRRAGLAGVGRW
jgi:hypothetical protein